MWVRDFLASDLDHYAPGPVRILTYGYDSTLFANNSNAGISEFSRCFLDAITNSRRESNASIPSSKRRTLIFQISFLLFAIALSRVPVPLFECQPPYCTLQTFTHLCVPHAVSNL